MDVLLREVRVRPDGRPEYVDTELSAERLVIGAGADCTVQVLGEGITARHAELRGSSGSFVLAALGQAKIKARVGDRERAAARHTLAAGDAFTIGGHGFAVFEPPAGFDLGLELRRDPSVPPSAYEAAFRTGLDATWLRKRGPAWVLLTLILLLCFAVPIGIRYFDGVPGGLARWLPDDRQWSTGPLLPAHQLAIGNDCSACHGRPFERVQDAACETCHVDLADHVHAALPVAGAVERCALCHREHNEPPSLVVTADSLCTGCHRREQAASDGGHVEIATAFTEVAHPFFDAHLLRSVQRPAGTGFAFDWVYEVVPVAAAQERSNLAFPHDLHLDPGKVASLRTSEPLGCGDCHTLAADREHFLPVTMERHCRDCHDLAFDDSDPERQLPHGQPIEAILAIEGHFLKKYSDPASDRGERERRRLPDRENRQEPCTDSAYACATRRTLAEAVNQFTVRGCVTCHAVEDNGNRDVYSRFQVLPIRLAHDYFPGARFDHASHLTQKGKAGDAACLTCHAADRSSTSTDLLVPDLATCTACHGPRSPGADRVVLGCIACHAYHPGPALEAMRNLPRTPGPLTGSDSP
jgi:predicted CXXCH cytochrome family protein